jgi:hypothetical protein
MLPEPCTPGTTDTMKNFRQVVILLLLGSVFFLTVPVLASSEAATPPASMLDYTVIGGEWRRTDGGYLIKISDVQADGQVKAEYFNPRPIHVAQSAISMQKELIKLFVQLQDKGYDGSTYTLFYYAEKDALVGFYYQAAMDRTFEVIFVRKE